MQGSIAWLTGRRALGVLLSTPAPVPSPLAAYFGVRGMYNPGLDEVKAYWLRRALGIFQTGHATDNAPGRCMSFVRTLGSSRVRGLG